MEQEEKSPRDHVQGVEPEKIRQCGECLSCACCVQGGVRNGSRLFPSLSLEVQQYSICMQHRLKWQAERSNASLGVRFFA